MRLIIASRKSDLAKIQAYLVRDALQKTHPSLKIEHHFRESLGDINLTDPLWKMPERGVFTEDFAQGLIRGEYDLVVHSWKDLPIEPRAETEIIATLPRADVRDLLLLRPEAVSKKNWKILSSSPRRAANLPGFFNDFLPVQLDSTEFQSVRGNVPRRIQKLLAGEGDGMIVAKAALDRLLDTTWDEFAETRKQLREALSQLWVFVLPVEINPPAPAQGAVAIEISRDRADLKALLSRINDENTMKDVLREREFLSGFGGGCHLAIGALSRTEDSSVRFLAKGVTPEGRAFQENSLVGEVRGLRPEGLNENDLVVLDHADLFTTEALQLQDNIKAEAQNMNLFIAHANALTADVRDLLKDQKHSSSWIWSSGLSSWRKLAAQGYWVRGSFENLGGRRPPVSHLEVPRREWLKLTFEDASDEGSLGVYRNIPKTNLENVATKLKAGHYFYWKSPGLLKAALDLAPEIKDRHHACGLGQSRAKIEMLLGRKIEGLQFLSEREWRNFCMGSTNSTADN